MTAVDVRYWSNSRFIPLAIKGGEYDSDLGWTGYR